MLGLLNRCSVVLGWISVVFILLKKGMFLLCVSIV